jgi:uncharacterized protein with NAD-binding domain and iron-sulfur cluster
MSYVQRVVATEVLFNLTGYGNPQTATYKKFRGFGLLDSMFHLLDAPLDGTSTAVKVLELIVEKIIEALIRYIEKKEKIKDEIVKLLVKLRKFALTKIFRPFAQLGGFYYFARLALDLMLTSVIALLGEDIDTTLEPLDKYELRELYAKYGILPEHRNNAVFRGFYSLVFGYEDGDSDKACVSAAGALRSYLCILNYVEYPYYRFEGSMAEALLNPMFEALVKLNVKVRFFSFVKELHSSDGENITSIDLCQQAEVRYCPYNYNPFTSIQTDNGEKMVWTLHPKWSQLVDPDPKKDYESYYEDWPTNTTLELRKDYDHVVCGIAVGGLKYVAKEMAEQQPEKWAPMFENLKTVSTASCAIWLNRPTEELGMDFKSGIVAGFYRPIDTFSDFTYLIDDEDWPQNDKPKGLMYFCGPFRDSVIPPPKPKPRHREYPARMNRECRQLVESWFKYTATLPFPRTATNSSLSEFDWNLLFVPNQGEDAVIGPERFNSQFVRAWSEPTERYTLSLPGTVQYRLNQTAGPEGSGYKNLYLTGDWTSTYLQCGAADPSIQSGMLAARALSGKCLPIWKADF